MAGYRHAARVQALEQAGLTVADDKPANFGNSVDWWTTTKAPRGIFKPAYQNPETDAFLRETVGVDAAILVADLHINASQIHAYQRRLGIRKLTGNAPRKTRPRY